MKVMMIFKSSVKVDNQDDEAMTVFIEPWGDVLTLEPLSSFLIVAESPLEGELEVVKEEHSGCTVYAWPGSTCRVFLGKQVVREFLYAVPGLPPGWSTRDFIGRVIKGE
jgi:hypothetical protein